MLNNLFSVQVEMSSSLLYDVGTVNSMPTFS